MVRLMSRKRKVGMLNGPLPAGETTKPVRVKGTSSPLLSQFLGVSRAQALASLGRYTPAVCAHVFSFASLFFPTRFGPAASEIYSRKSAWEGPLMIHQNGSIWSVFSFHFFFFLSRTRGGNCPSNAFFIVCAGDFSFHVWGLNLRADCIALECID